MKVEEIMTADPVTIRATATVRDALEILREEDIRHLPVMKEDELVGVLSDRDMRSFMLPLDMEAENPSAALARLDCSVGDVVQDDVLSVSPETEVTELIDIMIDQKIGALPVCEEPDGRLVGIVSYIDALKAVQSLV